MDTNIKDFFSPPLSWRFWNPLSCFQLCSSSLGELVRNEIAMLELETLSRAKGAWVTTDKALLAIIIINLQHYRASSVCSGISGDDEFLCEIRKVKDLCVIIITIMRSADLNCVLKSSQVLLRFWLPKFSCMDELFIFDKHQHFLKGWSKDKHIDLCLYIIIFLWYLMAGRCGLKVRRLTPAWERARVQAPLTPAIFYPPTYFNWRTLIRLEHVVLASHIKWKKIMTDPPKKEK